MAYVDKEKKAKIAAALKRVVPKGWKYSLAVDHHSTIVMTIQSADVDLIHAFKPSPYYNPDEITHHDVNPYHYESHLLDDSPLLPLFDAIFGALNIDNFDNSDIQTDYFHVGHYVRLHIGRWDKPFKYLAPLPVAA